MKLIAKARNINSNMSKRNLIYALIRSKPVHNEEKYFSYLNADANNDIHNVINKIRLQLFDVSQYLKKKELYDIRKRLYDTEKLTKINRSEKSKLINYEHKLRTK